jgi:hypothetical protein
MEHIISSFRQKLATRLGERSEFLSPKLESHSLKRKLADFQTFLEIQRILATRVSVRVRSVVFDTSYFILIACVVLLICGLDQCDECNRSTGECLSVSGILSQNLKQWVFRLFYYTNSCIQIAVHSATSI